MIRDPYSGQDTFKKKLKTIQGGGWALLLLMVLASTAAAEKTPLLPNEAWGQLLVEYVDHGRVDYGRLGKKPEILKQSIREFSRISRQTYGKWNRDDQIAFWINAYNLFTIKAIVDDYPPRGWNLLYPKVSIRQIGKVWEKAVYRAGGQLVSLSQIEHEILRGIFKEPRIHFALVCASLGCPPLPSKPYEGDSLEEMLDQQVNNYFADQEHGLRWDKEKRTLYLSAIFSWFSNDFRYSTTVHKLFPNLPEKQRHALNFLWEYLPEELQQSLSEENFKVVYLKYDWSLNDQ